MEKMYAIELTDSLLGARISIVGVKSFPGLKSYDHP
jgi:hypothetical protein